MNSPLETISIEERAALVSGADTWSTRAVGDVPSLVLTDGPHGVRLQDPSLGHGGFGRSHPATCFPTAAGLAASWDLDLVRRIGEALGRECRALGVHVLLGPGINIKRSPLCGRNFEYYSEDPLLAGELGVAWVNGLQSTGVAASVKHFAANNQETNRMTVSAEVDEQTLREIYLAAFERVVKRAAPATVMASYNRINGVASTANPWLLTDVLRNEWGFAGLVVSDWGAVEDPAAAVAAGLDLEMPGNDARRSVTTLVEAVGSGRLSEDDLTRASHRVAALAAAYHREPTGSAFDHHELATEAAAAAAVLLKNDGPLLPLAPGAGRLAVIGEFARTPRYQGAGSSQVQPTRLDAGLDAIRELVAGRREVTFAPGFSLTSDAEADTEALVSEAVRLAAAAEDAVLFLGLPAAEESEGFDRTHLDLPAGQRRLLSAVASVNPRVVVLLSNGGLVTVADWARDAAAILELGLGGQAGGTAAARLLFGAESPSGKLAETIPLALRDTPAFLNFPGDGARTLYGERHYVGYRFYDTVGREVAYPFGHGLSYTSFEYGDVVVDRTDGQVRATVTVTNTGTRAGAEVVQFYASGPATQPDRPARRLVAFAKVPLAPGESARVVVDIADREFASYSTRHQAWVIAGGRYELTAAASSRDLRSTTGFVLDRTEPETPLGSDSTVREWMDDPSGRAALLSVISTLGFEVSITNPEVLPLVEQIPLKKLLAMIDPSLIDRVLAAHNG